MYFVCTLLIIVLVIYVVLISVNKTTNEIKVNVLILTVFITLDNVMTVVGISKIKFTYTFTLLNN